MEKAIQLLIGEKIRLFGRSLSGILTKDEFGFFKVNDFKFHFRDVKSITFGKYEPEIDVVLPQERLK